MADSFIIEPPTLTVIIIRDIFCQATVTCVGTEAEYCSQKLKDGCEVETAVT